MDAGLTAIAAAIIAHAWIGKAGRTTPDAISALAIGLTLTVLIAILLLRHAFNV